MTPVGTWPASFWYLAGPAERISPTFVRLRNRIVAAGITLFAEIDIQGFIEISQLRILSPTVAPGDEQFKVICYFRTIPE